MHREWTHYIDDILYKISLIWEFIKGYSYKDFLEDTKTQYAVIYALQNIGEAVKRIPKEIKEEYPSIPWRKIAGFRDITAHKYFDIDVNIIWVILEKELDNLEKEVYKLKKNMEQI